MTKTQNDSSPPCYGFFLTMAHPLRLKIVSLLLRDGPCNVTRIYEAVGEEQSKVSHNLKLLRDCRIIEAGRNGKSVTYSINKETITPLFALIDLHWRKYCKGVCTAGRRQAQP